MTIIHTIAAYALAPSHTYVASSYIIPTPIGLAVRVMTRVVFDILVDRYPLPSSCDEDYDCEDYDYRCTQLEWEAEYIATDLVNYGMTPAEVRELGFRAIELVQWAQENQDAVEIAATCVDNPISVVSF